LTRIPPCVIVCLIPKIGGWFDMVKMIVMEKLIQAYSLRDLRFSTAEVRVR